MKKEPEKPVKTACLLTFLIALALCASILLLPGRGSADAAYTACLYQDGELIREIPLDSVTEPYRFTVTAKDGGTNTVEVRPGSIGILSADCPDQICVRQGFLDRPFLPITCLPHRLVIRLKENLPPADAPDGITY